MLVVLGISMLLLSAVIGARPKITALRLRSEARTIAAELSRARGEAMARNHETSLRIDTDHNVLRLGQSSRVLPRGLTVAMTVADTERAGASGGLRFYPDGQSSGGDIVLQLDGQRAQIAVNWLTGQVRLN